MSPRFICPFCSTPLDSVDDGLVCPRDGWRPRSVDGALDFLTDAERAHHASFLEDYVTIRSDERRGLPDPTLYLALPDIDLPGERGEEWRQRAESMRWLREYLAGRGAGPLTILDAGAGNCWLTRHLAEWGHEVVALDLNLDPEDGLGAGRHYLSMLPIRFERVRADYRRLPFADAGFDLVIFNGAFHYAEDPAATLAEVVRVLRPGGVAILIDTPFYHDRESGEKMVAGRRTAGRARFVTYDEIERLARDAGLGLELHAVEPSPLKRLKIRLTELRIGREIASMPRIILRTLSPPHAP